MPKGEKLLGDHSAVSSGEAEIDKDTVQQVEQVMEEITMRLDNHHKTFS